MYTCPICGYNELSRPPSNWLICPCCRTKFGYSDVGREPQELRSLWIANGAPWGSVYTEPPADWDAIYQLRNIEYDVNPEEARLIRGYTNVITIGADQGVLHPHNGRPRMMLSLSLGPSMASLKYTGVSGLIQDASGAQIDSNSTNLTAKWCHA